MSILTYISSEDGDWCGIYIDDKLYTEGHSITVHDWLDLLRNHNISMTYTYEVNGEWLEMCGSFPAEFKDIPEEMY